MKGAPRTYLVVLGHFNHMGGAERQAIHLIRFLREKLDARVAVLGWYGEGELTPMLQSMGCETYNFPYREIAPKSAKLVNLARLALFIRRRIQPDYILPFVATHSKPICQIWRYTGAKYAWWNQQDEGRGLFGTRAEKNALSNAVHITSNSEVGADFLAATYQIPRDHIQTYNNGTVVPEVDAIRPVWRQRLDIPANVPLVSMVANVTPYKDHDTLLKAWKYVLSSSAASSSPSPVLLLAGHLKDLAHVQKLKVQAFDLGLGTSVRFVGAIDSTDALMKESALLVHSSIREGCPNSVCEAMALAKAVVATDIPGNRQALPRDSWPVCLAPAEDAQALAERIQYLLSNFEQAGRLGALNRERIRREFSIEGMCEFFLELMHMQDPLTGRWDRPGKAGV